MVQHLGLHGHPAAVMRPPGLPETPQLLRDFPGAIPQPRSPYGPARHEEVAATFVHTTSTMCRYCVVARNSRAIRWYRNAHYMTSTTRELAASSRMLVLPILAR